MSRETAWRLPFIVPAEKAWIWVRANKVKDRTSEINESGKNTKHIRAHQARLFECLKITNNSTGNCKLKYTCKKGGEMGRVGE